MQAPTETCHHQERADTPSTLYDAFMSHVCWARGSRAPHITEPADKLGLDAGDDDAQNLFRPGFTPNKEVSLRGETLESSFSSRLGRHRMPLG